MNIMVSDRRLAELLHTELRLIALQNAGVDSWEGAEEVEEFEDAHNQIDAELKAGTLTASPEYEE